MQWSGRTRFQLLSQPPENRDVPRLCGTPCNKGLRATNWSALVRLLTAGARASNEDHTLRHINPAIVRGGSGSEASMTHCDLPSAQSSRRQHQNISCSAVAGNVSCGMCRSGYSAALVCLRGNYSVRPVMDCDDGVSFCLYSVPTRYSLFYSGSSHRGA
jgi:hypothetical protein